MKKLITLFFALSCAVAQAGPHHGYRHHHHGGNWGWVAPAVIGGLVVYGATRASTPPPPPVVYNPPQSLPIPPVGYRYEQLLDANCNCYRWVLVYNQ